jgi:rod shape-determining protein MreC
MAPPGNRRPGFNRKAQYGLFASYVIAMLGALAGLLLLAISIADPTGFSVLRAGAAEITRPISVNLRAIVVGVGNLEEAIAAYINAGSQNAALRRQVETNRTRLIEAEAIKQENIRLKELLKLTEADAGIVANGHLISSTSSSTARMARLDMGHNEGIFPGMPVRAPEGLVGRILRSGPSTADVLLIIDEGNVIPVRRTSDNIPGISTGRGDGTVEVRALNTERNPFVPGDVLVTSGIGGIYRPNIPVAIVARREADKAIAIPLANPSRVELVAVQAPFRPEEAARANAEDDASNRAP